MPDKVKCTVSDCKFYDREFCKASAIEVNVDGGGDLAGGTSERTNCHTYQSRR